MGQYEPSGKLEKQGKQTAARVQSQCKSDEPGRSWETCSSFPSRCLCLCFGGGGVAGRMIDLKVGRSRNEKNKQR